MSGKGSAPRPIPDRQGYEANWDAINWNTRDGMSNLHGDAPENGDAYGAGQVQPDDGQGVPTGPQG